MKTELFLLVCACLINGLAESFNIPLEDENTNVENSGNFFDIDGHLNIFFPDNGKAENLIIPYPTGPDTAPTTTRRPPTTAPTSTPWTTPYPTSTVPTSTPWTTPYPTSTIPTSTPWTSTTTRRPRPTTPWPSTTTRRPRPTTRRPGRVNPQIYNNAVRSLGPFAGRLNNVVLNKKGIQNTVQENKILYNLRFLKPFHRFIEEENEN